MDICYILLIYGLATFANGQFQDGLMETGIGFIDGLQVRTDDLTEPRLGGRLSQNLIPAVRNIGLLASNRGSLGSNLGLLASNRGSLGSNLGPLGSLRSNLRPLGSNLGPLGSNLGPLGPNLGSLGGLSGSLGHVGRDRLPSCRATVCTLQDIRPKCRYTPVLRSTFGDHCLGCPEDICETRKKMTQRQRRRRRRIRKRLCRNNGICLDKKSDKKSGRKSGRKSGSRSRNINLRV